MVIKQKNANKWENQQNRFRLDLFNVISGKSAKLSTESWSAKVPAVIAESGHCEQVTVRQLDFVYLLRFVGVNHSVDLRFG